MIFTQADRDHLERVKSMVESLWTSIGLRGKDEASVHAKLNDLKAVLPILNELGAALGRIEAAVVPKPPNTATEAVARQDAIDRSRRMGEAIAALPDLYKELLAAVNRRADEALDVVRGRNDVTNNAIVALSGRVAELTGLVQAEVSEASSFRKESKALIAALDRIFTQVLTDREQFPSMDEMMQKNREILAAMMERDTKPKRKARRKKK